MSKISSLFEYFKSRNEENAINKTLVHMQKVLECIVEFEKALSFLIQEKNVDLALKVFFRVDELEHQADGIRRNILNMLSQAQLTSTIRENLMHLVKRIDDIANTANSSARLLISMNHKDFFNLGDEILNHILTMAHHTVEATKKVNQMVNKLMSSDKPEIQKLGEDISILEHKCDEKRYAINRLLVSNASSVTNPFSAISIHNCIGAIEAITDNVEEVADYIIMLTVAKRN